MAPRCEPTHRPSLLCKVTMGVKVEPAIFGLGTHAGKPSLGVSGLQKPPAGSGWGRRGRETGRLEGGCGHGRGASSFTREASNGPGSPRPFPGTAGSASTSSKSPLTHPHPIPTGSGTLFKAYMVIRKMRQWGEKSQTHHEGQLWPTDPKLPRSQQKAVSSVTKLLLHGRALSSVPPDPTAGVCFTFSANDTHMESPSSGCPPPPLSERGKKNKERREKETDKSGLGVIWQACLRGPTAFSSERLPRLRARGDPHYRIQGFYRTGEVLANWVRTSVSRPTGCVQHLRRLWV